MDSLPLIDFPFRRKTCFSSVVFEWLGFSFYRINSEVVIELKVFGFFYRNFQIQFGAAKALKYFWAPIIWVRCGFIWRKTKLFVTSKKTTFLRHALCIAHESKWYSRFRRLDYFVVSERLIDKVSDSLIRQRVKGSDHCPVVLLLAL